MKHYIIRYRNNQREEVATYMIAENLATMEARMWMLDDAEIIEVVPRSAYRWNGTKRTSTKIKQHKTLLK